MQACGTTMGNKNKNIHTQWPTIINDRADSHCVIHVWRILNRCFEQQQHAAPCTTDCALCWVGTVCAAAVLRAVWTRLVSLGIRTARLVWQEVISAPERLCCDRLSYQIPPSATVPPNLNGLTGRYVIFVQICSIKKQKMICTNDSSPENQSRAVLDELISFSYIWKHKGTRQ